QDDRLPLGAEGELPRSRRRVGGAEASGTRQGAEEGGERRGRRDEAGHATCPFGGAGGVTGGRPESGRRYDRPSRSPGQPAGRRPPRRAGPGGAARRRGGGRRSRGSVLRLHGTATGTGRRAAPGTRGRTPRPRPAGRGGTGRGTGRTGPG